MGVQKPGSTCCYQDSRDRRLTDLRRIGHSQRLLAVCSSTDLWKLSVYSLSLGGFGPVEYFFHLLTNQAFKLSPEVVIVGFYLGNDLFDAYKVVQTNEHWQHLRYAGFTAAAHDASNPADKDRTVYRRLSRSFPVSDARLRNTVCYTTY